MERQDQEATERGGIKSGKSTVERKGKEMSETVIEGTVKARAIRHVDGVIEKRVLLKLPGIGEYVMTPRFARLVAETLIKGAEAAEKIEPWEVE
jgi:hypothetical protein